MSYAYTPCVGRLVLVTFQKNPRVLDENDQAVRVIAAVAEVEAVGEETVSLLLSKVYPHRSDVEADGDAQPVAEMDPPLELTLRSDAILAMSPIDDEFDDEADDDGLNMDDDDDDDDDGEDDDPDDGEHAPVIGRIAGGDRRL